jgi:hypothetical protein
MTINKVNSENQKILTNMNIRINEIKDYKLIGICNKNTDNQVVLDNICTETHYKKLIESHKDTINHNGISKCYICNHKIKDIYFLNKDNDIKIIGGSGCLNKFGNIKVNCKCCMEECDITIRDFEINIMKDKKIDNLDYICEKCKSYKDITHNQYQNCNKNYYNDWIFKNINDLCKDYSMCNSCNYIYKTKKNDIGLCRYCKDNDMKCLKRYVKINKKLKYNNIVGGCYCKNCCFKNDKLHILLDNEDTRNKIQSFIKNTNTLMDNHKSCLYSKLIFSGEYDINKIVNDNVLLDTLLDYINSFGKNDSLYVCNNQRNNYQLCKYECNREYNEVLKKDIKLCYCNKCSNLDKNDRTIITNKLQEIINYKRLNYMGDSLDREIGKIKRDCIIELSKLETSKNIDFLIADYNNKITNIIKIEYLCGTK